MRMRRQITLHLDPDIIGALDAEGPKRGLNASRAANDALRGALIADEDADIPHQVKLRLDRLDKRDAVRARERAIIKEAFMLLGGSGSTTPGRWKKATIAMLLRIPRRGFMDLFQHAVRVAVCRTPKIHS